MKTRILVVLGAALLWWLVVSTGAADYTYGFWCGSQGLPNSEVKILAAPWLPSGRAFDCGMVRGRAVFDAQVRHEAERLGIACSAPALSH